MKKMSYPLSILDQSPIFSGRSASDAFKSTVLLAKAAEQWGYKRFWVSEHHHMENVAGTSPEILMAHLLAHTEKINIGSGGVMLQHYSPYKIAENFHVLSSLASGRVDLGVGKAPGGLDLSTKALQFGTMNDGTDFSERLTFLKQLIDDNIPNDHPLIGIKAMPQPLVKPEIFLLGASENSAKMAANLETHFVFAQFINNSEEILNEASNTYRTLFPNGKFITAVSVLAAETDEEATKLAKDIKLYQINFKDGRSLTVQSIDQIQTLENQTTVAFEAKEKDVTVFTGTAEKIKQELDRLHKTYEIDEFILHTPLQNEIERRRSFELLGPENEYSRKKVFN